MSALQHVAHGPRIQRGGDEIVARVAEALRDPRARCRTADAKAADALVAAAARHRVLVLLGSRLREAGTLELWPREFGLAFRAAERRSVALEFLRRAELARVLGALAAARVDALVFKGAALAHVIYPAPHLRPRTDSDVLVRAVDASRLDALFASLGYERQQESSGSLMSYQSHYGRTDRHGVFHAFDMHWKISNRQALADRLTFDELWERRAAVPPLGPTASTVDPVHALLLALVHRAGHHPGSPDLLWLYDVHLLAGALTDHDAADFEELAAARGVAAIAAEGLGLARARFGTIDRDWLARASSGRPPGDHDAAPIEESSSQTDLLYMDLRALATWRERLRLVREHLLPAPAYIRAKYGLRSNALVPVFYLWRVVAGAPKWISRGAAAR